MYQKTCSHTSFAGVDNYVDKPVNNCVDNYVHKKHSPSDVDINTVIIKF